MQGANELRRIWGRCASLRDGERADLLSEYMHAGEVRKGDDGQNEEVITPDAARSAKREELRKRALKRRKGYVPDTAHGAHAKEEMQGRLDRRRLIE